MYSEALRTTPRIGGSDSFIARDSVGLEKSVVLKGSEAVVKILEREFRDYQAPPVVFGIQGGKVISLFDSLSKSDIRIVSCGQEGAAGHMAEGYAESTGKVGVVIATSGPGATNLMTPVLDAFMDSVPIVAITGQVPANDLGSMAFQEGPVFEMMKRITKKSYLVTHPDVLVNTLREAFAVARSGRPGPVSVDITSNVWGKELLYHPDKPFSFEQPVKGRDRFKEASVEEVLEALLQSERPIIQAGGGVKVAGAHKELFEFARRYNVPVITTLKALGCFPKDSDLHLGMAGMHGGAYATNALFSADFVLFIGSRVDDRVIPDPDEFLGHGRNGKPKTIAHVDVDPYEINKRLDPERRGGERFRSLPINTDAKSFLEEALRINPYESKSFSGWHEQINAWRREYPLPRFSRIIDDGKGYPEGLIKPQFVLETLDRLLQEYKGEFILTTGVGQHQMFAAQYMTPRGPRKFITSGGAGTMGFGLPAAIGAQLANPDALVVNIDGDGSFNMNSQELRTLYEQGIPVKTVILHNGSLGMVRQWQDLMFKENRVATAIGSSAHPDFAAGAFAQYGMESARISEYRLVEPGIRRMMQSQGPFVLDVVVDPDEHVLPMIMPGKPVNEMRTHKG
ncbi:biosynthetic-type acetolactate synthase large subunit [Candidatus Woesearchaeota archaeon]|nr:biosynthetic-type acetolactate synthase large subunit [Candidatus Woesearchaeota archaeon]